MLSFAFLCLLQKRLRLPSKWVDAFRSKAGRWLLTSRINLAEEFSPEEQIDTPIVVSNHVCWFDMAYMGSCFRALSFVAKR
jgi:1-acyl-sn-glycerol-3-phosphate acyltransferase